MATPKLLLYSLFAFAACIFVYLTAGQTRNDNRYQPLSTRGQPVIDINLHKGKALVMGLPRSGSLAIHEFFTCNGLNNAAHYCCDDDSRTSFPCNSRTCGECILNNAKSAKPIFEGCSNSNDNDQFQLYSQFDVESSEPFSWFLPQHFMIPLILHKHNTTVKDSNEEMIWIVNRRDSAATWVEGMIHWRSITHRILQAFGISYYSKVNKALEAPTHELRPSGIRKDMTESIGLARSLDELERRKKALTSIYDRHYEHLDSIVASSSNLRVIYVNVDDGNAGKVLADNFVGFKSSCWNFDAAKLDNDWKDFSLPF